MYHPILSNALSGLNTHGRNLMYHSNLTNAIGSHISTSDFLTLGRKLMYHSILSKALRQTYLYKLFVDTSQEPNVSFHSDQRSYAVIRV